MTLEDNENGKEIVDPYITLYSPEGSWVALNTETFRDAQNSIIHLNDGKNYIKYVLEMKARAYKVVATIGKQEHAFDYEAREYWTRGVGVSGVRDAVALVSLGYILEEIVKELFPASFKYFEGECFNEEGKLVQLLE